MSASIPRNRSTRKSNLSLSAPDSSEAKSGIIARVRLADFMNHASLDLRLHPGINIITGPNGAGKSSILQAIVLGLGGQAKDTKRATSIGHFVRQDQSKAEISVWLQNTGSSPFKPQKYGEQILFERTILSSGTSRHILKNSDGQKQYEGKEAMEEKARILSHFNIEVDNPTIILQQEEAKMFFKNLSDSSLFRFFYRATLLKQMQSNYLMATSDLMVAKEKVNELKRKEAAVKERLDELQDYRQSAEMKDQSRKELHWLLAGRKREEMREKKAEVEKLTQDLVRLRSELETHQKELREKQQSKESLQMKVKLQNEEVQLINSEIRGLKDRESKARTDLEDHNNNCKELDAELSRSRQKIHHVKNKIRTETLRAEENDKERDAKRAKVRENLDEVTKKVDEKETRIQILGQEREKIDAEITATMDQIRQQNGICQEKANEQQANRDEMKAYQKHASDLSRFGRDMENLVKCVENSSSFQRKPKGPVARYLHVNEGAPRNVIDLLETELGNALLKSFLVDNNQDKMVLDDLIKKCCKQKPPRICIMKFKNRRVDVEKKKVSTDGMETILDMLSFDDNDVFNYVVEEKHIASTLVLRNQDLACKLFSRVENVPKNATRAITHDFFSFIPATKAYSSFYMTRSHGANLLVADNNANYQRLKESNDQLSKKIEEIKDILHGLEKKEYTMKMKKRELVDAIQRERNILSQLLSNKTSLMSNLDKLTDGESELESLQEQLKTTEEMITKLVQIREELRAKTPILKNSKAEAEIALKEGKAKLTRKENGDEDFEQRLVDIERECKALTLEAESYNRKIRECERKLANAQSQLCLFERQYEGQREKALAKSNGKEITVTRTVTEHQAFMKHNEEKAEAFKKKFGKDVTQVSKMIRELETKLVGLTTEATKLNEKITETSALDEARKGLFNDTAQVIFRRIKMQFASQMAANNMRGKLHIDSDKGILKIDVNTSKKRMLDDTSSEMQGVPILTLSGGERSKTLVCFIIAIWYLQYPPFRCLDEWDVFLDEVSRAEIEKLLSKHANQSKYQYLFISPQKTTLKGNVIEIGTKRSQDPK